MARHFGLVELHAYFIGINRKPLDRRRSGPRCGGVLSQGMRRFVLVEISFSSVEQARAVRDVIEHRILSVPTEVDQLSELELIEVMDLATFHHRLAALIDKEEGE